MNFFFFFFSSRRRHTSSDRDWSSDVCSSDLHPDHRHDPVLDRHARDHDVVQGGEDRSEERRVGKSVDLGGRRIIKKKKIKTITASTENIFYLGMFVGGSVAENLV